MYLIIFRILAFTLAKMLKIIEKPNPF